MTLTIYRDFEQNTSYWRYARMGMPTASCFKKVMAAQGSQERKTRSRYQDDLLAELCTGNPTEGYRNKWMDLGSELQPEALTAYLDCSPDAEIDPVAFVRRDDLLVGCSPDGLIGDDGGVEVKMLIPGLMVRLLLNPCVPPEHVAQIQGSLWVTDRKWWDLFVYSPGLEPVLLRVERDEPYIQQLAAEVRIFNTELEKNLMRLRGLTLKSARRILDQRLRERIEDDNEISACDKDEVITQ